MLVFISFLLLAALTFSLEKPRRAALARGKSDWLLDAAGLAVQGLAIPFLQTTLVYGLFAALAPRWRGALDLPPVAAFLLNFVLVDYLYYWNHRTLHGRRLWATHAVHHTAEHLDLFVTSRNTLWASLLIVYVWVNGLFIYLLKEPAPFILSVAITASLDLWRHTSFGFDPGSRFSRAAALVFITPNEHAWHHSRARARNNFGANLSLWDRLHGTYVRPETGPEELGIPSGLTVSRKLLFPFKARQAGGGP